MVKNIQRVGFVLVRASFFSFFQKSSIIQQYSGILQGCLGDGGAT